MTFLSRISGCTRCQLLGQIWLTGVHLFYDSFRFGYQHNTNVYMISPRMLHLQFVLVTGQLYVLLYDRLTIARSPSRKFAVPQGVVFRDWKASQCNVSATAQAMSRCRLDKSI